MIKRILVLVFLFVFLGSSCLADSDYSSMTDQDLIDLISSVSAELRSRRFSPENNGIELIDEGGFRVYQTGDAYLSSSGRLKVPVIVYNDLDVSASLSFDSASCNDFVVHGFCYTTFPPKTKAFEELDFSSEDVGLQSVFDIFSLRYCWKIYSPDSRTYVYEHPEIEEHRFW